MKKLNMFKVNDSWWYDNWWSNESVSWLSSTLMYRLIWSGLYATVLPFQCYYIRFQMSKWMCVGEKWWIFSLPLRDSANNHHYLPKSGILIGSLNGLTVFWTAKMDRSQTDFTDMCFEDVQKKTFVALRRNLSFVVWHKTRKCYKKI